MASYRGRYKDADGVWREEQGTAEVKHLGPTSRVSTWMRGSGEVTWRDGEGTGPFRVGDQALTLRARKIDDDTFEYTIEDEWGEAVSVGRIES